MKRSEFANYHPVTNFCFFFGALVLSVVLFHPLALALSLLAAILFAVKIAGKTGLKFLFGMPLIIMILATVLNPLFVHKGLTVLFYVGESPITKEAFVYGATTALMLGAVIMWFYCYSLVMTSDRFMAVFGKVAPATSLVFSMILRFIPRTARQAESIAMAQRCLARDVTNGEGAGSKEPLRRRIKEGIRTISITTTWALENSIDTADSMRARGYALTGHTSYSNYDWRIADVLLLIVLLATAVGSIAAKAIGAWRFSCYPTMDGTLPGPSWLILVGLFFLAPLIIELVEEARWKRSRSLI